MGFLEGAPVILHPRESNLNPPPVNLSVRCSAAWLNRLLELRPRQTGIAVIVERGVMAAEHADCALWWLRLTAIRWGIVP